MTTRLFFLFCMGSLLFVSFVCLATTIHAVESKSLAARLYIEVESLKLSRNGYVLASELTGPQKETAEKNMLESSTPGTFRFMDNGLTIVADSRTDKVLLIMESIDNALSRKVQDLMGSFFMHYDQPTLFVHGRIVYWAYGTKGKYSSLEFEKAKKAKKILPIIATVKLQSELNILEKSPPGKKRTGNIYYIISSEAILSEFMTE